MWNSCGLVPGAVLVTKFPRPRRGMRPMRSAHALLLGKAGNDVALDYF
jgi:hypothetical protein